MNKDEWQQLYDRSPSVSAMAREMGVSKDWLNYRLHKMGVEIRTTGYKSPKSVKHYGPDHHSWKGGNYRHSDGYIYEYAPNHPAAAGAKGYVLQHRLVMEDKLGRLLEPWELVHHINEIKDDNRPGNLELHDHSTHMKHHKAGAPRDRRGRFA